MTFRPYLAMACLTVMTIAHAAPSSQEHTLNEYIKHTLPDTTVGVIVQRADTGETLYEHQAHQNFYPASVTKLFTTVTALEQLGEDYRFSTQFTGQRQKQTVQGDLTLKLSGDPSLTAKDLYHLIEELQSEGIREIAGDVLIDTSIFGLPETNPHWMLEDTAWYFAAPASAAIVNQNKIAITLTPGKTLGEKATVSWVAEDHMLPVSLTAEVITVTQIESETTCQLNVESDRDNHIHLSGCWPIGENATSLKLAIQYPVRYLQDLLAYHFTDLGIAISGRIRPGTGSAGKVLAAHPSIPLHDMLITLNHYSNNLYSDVLLKTLGATTYQQPGTFQNGAAAMQARLSEVTGIPQESFRFADGSGSSRFNLVRPTDAARLLYIMYNHPELKHAFASVLPSSGDSGTLRFRMHSFDVLHHFAGKTGSATGVSALAGYIEPPEGIPCIVVVFINNALLPGGALKAWEDALLTRIVPLTKKSALPTV